MNVYKRFWASYFNFRCMSEANLVAFNGAGRPAAL